jgi:CHAT domain-containing protein/Tfp pilus assembly protein PilF
VLYARGVRTYAEDRFPEAEELFTAAFDLARSASDGPFMARLLLALGHASLRRGDWELAEQRYRESIELSRVQGRSLPLAAAIQHLGILADERGQHAEAIRHYEEALALGRQTGDKNFITSTLTSIGVVHLDQGDYGRAHQVFLEALDTGSSDPEEVGFLLNNLGIVSAHLGMEDLAVERFRQALAAGEKTGSRFLVSRVTNNLALVHLGRGELEEALAHLQRALSLAEESSEVTALPEQWANIAGIYARQGRLEEAFDAYDRSLRLAREQGMREREAQTLQSLAGLHFGQGEWQATLSRADEAAAMAVETESRETFWKARTEAGRALRALGRLAEARAAFAQSILAVEQVRQALPGGSLEQRLFFHSRLLPYDEMVALEVAAGDAAAALRAAEGSKARALLDAQHRGALPEASPPPADQVEEDRHRKRLVDLNHAMFMAQRRGADAAELAALGGSLARARLDLEAFRLDREARSRAAGAERQTPPSWSREDLPRLVASPEVAYLEYVVRDRETFLFVLTTKATGAPMAVEVVRLSLGRKELEAAIADFRRRLSERDLEFEEAARGLYGLLLAPAEAMIAGRRTLAIVPDSLLWSLPFAALKPPSGEYLADRHAILFAPSLAVLSEIQRPSRRRDGEPNEAPAARTRVLALGDPMLPAVQRPELADPRRPQPLPPLPEAAEEVRAIARLYGAPADRVYVSERASEDVFKAEAPGSAVLHLATHGLLDDQRPLHSHLVLATTADARGEDGLLEAWEIAEMDLDADLVVLSSCHSASGRLGAGEGMIGLVWAFLAAGGRAVVAGLWELDSAATRELMIAFHRQLVGGASKADALRSAAREVRARTPFEHPFYWAGFQLLGDGLTALPP